MQVAVAQSVPMQTRKRRSLCPVACTLEILGDRWTMVIVRDLVRGARRYGDFLASPERITTSILADRLKRLESEGIVEKEPYQLNPPRFEYRLTRKGRDLRPLMKAMVAWAVAYRSEVILGELHGRQGPARALPQGCRPPMVRLPRRRRQGGHHQH